MYFYLMYEMINYYTPIKTKYKWIHKMIKRYIIIISYVQNIFFNVKNTIMLYWNILLLLSFVQSI